MEPELAAIVEVLVPGASVGTSYVRERLTAEELASLSRLDELTPGTPLYSRLRGLAWEALFIVGDGYARFGAPRHPKQRE